MTITKCPMCQQELSGTPQTCPHCGCSINDKMKNPELHQAVDCGELNNDKSKRNKVTSKIVINFAVVAAVVCAIVIVCTQIFSPMNRLNRLFDKRDYSAVSDLLSQNESNEEIQSAGQTLFNQAVQEVLFNYGSNIISKEDAKQELDNISVLGDVRESKMVLDAINRSRNNFSNAEDKFSKGDYLGAILRYGNVIELDIQNYNLAKEKIEICRTKYSEDAVAKADKMIANDEQIEAYQYLAGLDEKAITQIVTDKTEALKDDAVSKALSYSESLAADGKYIEAIDFLTQLTDIDYQLFDAKREYSKLFYTNVVNESKSAVSVNYDDMDKKYIIVPKGLKAAYVNISYSRNLEAKLVVKTGTPMFALCAGFQQDDWVFIENITFDCDGKQFKWEVDYFDRGSQVLYGAGIAEWYTVYDSTLASGYIQQMKDLEPLITAMRKAETVKIRFRGEGFKDVVISQNQIKQVITIWDIYQAMKFDVSLLDQLK